MTANDSKELAKTREKYGSFQDSLRAPIHRWFTYPAGYSYKLVEAKIKEYFLDKNHTILDPFLGTGTTSLAAKSRGINSIGIEAHPFVFWIAKTKLHPKYNARKLEEDAVKIQKSAESIYPKLIKCNGIWPALIYKCFTEDNLRQLLALRIAILEYPYTSEQRDFFKVALTATLRDVTSAGAGWPYIAPSKHAKRTIQRKALVEFEKRVKLMVNDVVESKTYETQNSQHILYNGDAREIEKYIKQTSIEMVLTSPPYLGSVDILQRNFHKRIK